jgi:regulator of cell morphogenesis and NO signaling
MTTTDQTFAMETASVADIALRFPQSIGIFNRYNLDYCCNGKKSFQQMCTKASLDAASVWSEILAKQEAATHDPRDVFENWELPLLIDHIVSHHHAYVRESIPQLQALLTKICKVHGDEHPELEEIRDEFNELSDELIHHLPKEENVLFPAIKGMIAKSNDRLLLQSIQAPVAVMEDEHETAGRLIKSIRSKTNNFTPPENACLSYQMTFKLLQEFEADLMQHIHLENNIVFPKALSLSQRF